MKFNIILILCLLIFGCAKYQYVEEPIDTGSLLHEINSWTLEDAGLKKFLVINDDTTRATDNRIFSIWKLYLTGLYFNPELRTAYKKMEKAKITRDHSDYYINPELSIPFEHHSDTSGGISRWTIGSVLNFIYERKGKREARVAEAEVRLLNAELELEKLARDNYFEFQKQYYSYLVTKAEIIEMENEVNVLRELLDQLQKKYELGGASQFEISTAALELQQNLFQLELKKGELQNFRDNLLTMTHVSNSEYDQIEIEYIDPLDFVSNKYQNSILLNEDISGLQTNMLDNHIDMALQLNNYAQSEANLQLEIENQYPDIVLSPGFIFDQSDNIWTLGVAWVLPLFENSKQNLQILEALEERKIRQQEIITLQKKLLDSLYQLHQSLLRHKETIRIGDEIITSIEQRAETIKRQLEAGGIDMVDFLRNRLEYYNAKQQQIEINHKAIDTMLEIEQLLQGYDSQPDIRQVVSRWVDSIEGKN